MGVHGRITASQLQVMAYKKRSPNFPVSDSDEEDKDEDEDEDDDNDDNDDNNKSDGDDDDDGDDDNDIDGGRKGIEKIITAPCTASKSQLPCLKVIALGAKYGKPRQWTKDTRKLLAGTDVKLKLVTGNHTGDQYE
ncbi:hypothetical protein CGGC5_v017309 [Colletotrichum fructicola Nara gc5]|uniref:Uncharacterized protein n=1 Tax=Colletotrichum fructicola (strain Nara gc5) TaxID=1213859 RepID=A0A7J6IDG1_COLFN|nr:hypothetical protein CGGC5_v017309 [Colletotrichum fructicola Nara gc5]